MEAAISRRRAERGSSLAAVKDIRTLLPPSLRRKSTGVNAKTTAAAAAKTTAFTAKSSSSSTRGSAGQKQPSPMPSAAAADPSSGKQCGIVGVASPDGGEIADVDASPGIRTAVVRQVDGAPFLPFRKSFSSSPMRRHAAPAGRGLLASMDGGGGDTAAGANSSISPPPSPNIYQFSSMLKYVKKSEESLLSSDDDDTNPVAVADTFSAFLAARRQGTAPVTPGAAVGDGSSKNGISSNASNVVVGADLSGETRRRPRSAPLYPPSVAYALSELRSPTGTGSAGMSSRKPLPAPTAVVSSSSSHCTVMTTTTSDRYNHQVSPFILDTPRQRKSIGHDSAIGLDDQLANSTCSPINSPPFDTDHLGNRATPPLLHSDGLLYSPLAATHHARQESGHSSGRGSRSPSITSDLSVTSADRLFVTSASMTTAAASPGPQIASSTPTSSVTTSSSNDYVIAPRKSSALDDDSVDEDALTAPLAQLASHSQAIAPSIVPKKALSSDDKTETDTLGWIGGNVAVSRNDEAEGDEPSDLSSHRTLGPTTSRTASQDDLDTSDSCNTLTSYATSITDTDFSTSSPLKRSHSSSRPHDQALHHDVTLRRCLSSASSASAAARLEEVRGGMRRDDVHRSSLVTPQSQQQRQDDGRLEDALSPSIVSVRMSMTSLSTNGTAVVTRERQQDLAGRALHQGLSSDTLHNTGSGVFADAVAMTMPASSSGGGQPPSTPRPTSLTDDSTSLWTRASSHDVLAAIEEPQATPPATPQEDPNMHVNHTGASLSDAGKTPSIGRGLPQTDNTPDPEALGSQSTCREAAAADAGSFLSMSLRPISPSTPAPVASHSSTSHPVTPTSPASSRRHDSRRRSLSSTFSKLSAIGRLARRRSGSNSSLGRRQSGSADGEGVSSPTKFRYVGRVIPSEHQQLNHKLVQTRGVELHRPTTGRFGFSLCQRTVSPPYPSCPDLARASAEAAAGTSRGFFVSRIADDDHRKLLAGMLEEGDQILRINGVSLNPAGSRAQITMDDVGQLMTTTDRLMLLIAPRLEIEEW